MTMPALETRISTRPKASVVSATRRSASARFDTSAWTTTASPPASAISRATASALSRVLTQFTATLAPSRAKRNAMARPMPRDEPVTIAVLPLSFMVPSLFARSARPRTGAG